VLIDSADIFLKQLRHQFLREPDRFRFEPALNTRAAILRLVKDDAGLRNGFVGNGDLMEFSIECLVQQRLLQRLQRGKLALGVVVTTLPWASIW
jgi:hypothetical protein